EEIAVRGPSHVAREEAIGDSRITGQRLSANDRRTSPALRLGLRYVRGLHEEAGRALVSERQRASFTTIHDLARRVPALRRSELNTLAEIGALNSIRKSSQRSGKTQSDLSMAQESISNVLMQSGYQFNSEDSSVTPHVRSRIAFHRRDALWSASAAAH